MKTESNHYSFLVSWYMRPPEFLHRPSKVFLILCYVVIQARASADISC